MNAEKSSIFYRRIFAQSTYSASSFGNFAKTVWIVYNAASSVLPRGYPYGFFKIICAIQNAIGKWVDQPAMPDRVLRELGKV